MSFQVLIEAANAFDHRNALKTFGIGGASVLHADIPAALRSVWALRDGFTEGPEPTPHDLGDRAMSGGRDWQALARSR
jgi:hypothetical protein